jgi:hypothetical protein
MAGRNLQGFSNFAIVVSRVTGNWQLITGNSHFAPMRPLFASIQSNLDASSGAAMRTKELLELLGARGMVCRAFCAGVVNLSFNGIRVTLMHAASRRAERSPDTPDRRGANEPCLAGESGQ